MAVAKRTFAAAPGQVPNVVSFVTRLASEAGIPADRVARLDIAVEEWATNVCRHAYQGQGGVLAVVVQRASDALVVELSDEGSPFDPTLAKEPDVTLPLAERTPGGLGLVLIRRMVDELRYRRDRDRNIVTFALRC